MSYHHQLPTLNSWWATNWRVHCCFLYIPNLKGNESTEQLSIQISWSCWRCHSCSCRLFLSFCPFSCYPIVHLCCYVCCCLLRGAGDDCVMSLDIKCSQTGLSTICSLLSLLFLAFYLCRMMLIFITALWAKQGKKEKKKGGFMKWNSWMDTCFKHPASRLLALWPFIL